MSDYNLHTRTLVGSLRQALHPFSWTIGACGAVHLSFNRVVGLSAVKLSYVIRAEHERHRNKNVARDLLSAQCDRFSFDTDRNEYKSASAWIDIAAAKLLIIGKEPRLGMRAIWL